MIYSSYNDAYKNRIVKNGERNHLIVSLIRAAVNRNKYVIVVVDRLLHLEEISERLEAKGIKHKIVAGTYKSKGISVEKRFKYKDKFETGEIKVLVVNKVFKKGIDIKRVDVIINATGKPSTNDAIQIFGRGVRLHKDKIGLICFDITDFTPDAEEKNWFSKAGKKRIRAYKKAGLTVKKIDWNDELKTKDIFQQAEKYLEKYLPQEIKICKT